MDLETVPDPAIFVLDLQDANGLLIFEGTFKLFLKDKKSLISHKTVGIKVFLTTVFLLDDRRRDPDPYL
jgi:hypothetical protein